MSSQPSSPTLPSETDVLTVSPPPGLAAGTAPAASEQSPTVSQSTPEIRPQVPNDPHDTPFVQSLSAILSDLDAHPSPLASSDIVATELLECASPLTERALCYQCRDASRIARDIVVLPPSPDTFGSNAILNTVPAQIPGPYRSNSPGTLGSNAILNTIPAQIPGPYRSNFVSTPPWITPVLRKLHKRSMAATMPRVTYTPHTADQPPFTAGPMYPPRDFSPLAPLRAFPSMSSSAAKSAAHSSGKMVAQSPTAATLPPVSTSPVAPTTFRDISGSGADHTRALRSYSSVPPRAFTVGPRGPPPHLQHLALVWDSLDPAIQDQMRLISIQDTGWSTPARRPTSTCWP